MRTPGRALLSLVAAGALAGCGGGRDSSEPEPVLPPSVSAPETRPKLRPAPKAPEDPLTARLSLEQQVAQVILVAPAAAQAGTRPWGGVVVTRRDGATAATLAGITSGARGTLAGRGPAAPLVAAEQPGGTGTAVPDLPPGPPAEFAGRTPAQARAAARAAGRRLKALGVDLVLAPPAGVNVEAGVLGDRLISSDPQEVAALAAAEVAGFGDAKLAAAPGQFPGTGAATDDPDTSAAGASVGLSRDELRARDLVPFKRLARSAPALQLSNALYAAYDGVTPATLEPAIARTLLRRELGFAGVAISPDLGGTALVRDDPAGPVAVAAFRAGADVLWAPEAREAEAAHAALLAAVRAGRVSRARLADSVSRLLALKRRFGILRG